MFYYSFLLRVIHFKKALTYSKTHPHLCSSGYILYLYIIANEWHEWIDADIEMGEIREERNDNNFHATETLLFEFPTIKKVLEKSRANIECDSYVPCHVSIGPHHRGSSSSKLLRKAEKLEWLGELKKAVADSNNKRPEVQVRYFLVTLSLYCI